MSEVLEKVEKEEKAQGPIFGGRVAVKDSPPTAEARHAVSAISEVYGQGYTELVVKCTRGEQKALSGDIAYQVTLTDEETGVETVYLFVIPGEAYEHIKDMIPPPPDGGVTVLEYNEFHQKRNKPSNELPRPPRASAKPPSQLPSPPTATRQPAR